MIYNKYTKAIYQACFSLMHLLKLRFLEFLSIRHRYFITKAIFSNI